MAEEIVESYLTNVYLWRISKREIGNSCDKILNKLNSMNEVLAKQYFETKIENLDSFSNHIRSYRKEIKMMIPNIRIDKNKFDKKLNGKFFKIKSKLIDFNIDAIHKILESLKSQFIYNEKIPKIFTSDLLLEKEEVLFKEKILKSDDLTLDFICKQIYEIFFKFFKASKEEFMDILKHNSFKILGDLDVQVNSFRSSMQEKIYSYLRSLVHIEKLVNIEVQIKKINDTVDLNENWETVHKGLLNSEETKLFQILKLSPAKSLIGIKLCESQLNLFVTLENFISHRLHKLSKADFDAFVPGSVPELMLAYSNSQRKMLKGFITDREIVLKEEIDFYKSDETNIVSSALVRHQLIIIYVNLTGSVNSFPLKNTEKLDLASVYPQKYKKVLVSDCERFIFLISQTNFNIFNSSMHVVTFHKVCPVSLQLIDDNLKIIVQGEEGYESKTFSLVKGKNDASPNTEVKMEKVKLLTRLTYDFGKALIKDMFSSNDFLAELEKNEEYKKNDS